MRARKMIVSIVALIMLATSGLSPAFAQDAKPNPRPGGRPGGGWDPARMHQRYLDRIKGNITITDDEWTALKPELEKVMILARDTRPGRRGRRGGRRPGPTDAATQTETQKATQALRQTLENEAATPEDISAKLTELRAAREKAKQELAKAQAALRELLTPRQEAQLALMGIIN